MYFIIRYNITIITSAMLICKLRKISPVSRYFSLALPYVRSLHLDAIQAK